MASETTALLLQSLLQRQQAERQNRYGIEQTNRTAMTNAMLGTLNSFLTMAQNAKGGSDMKAAYSALNRQWKVLTKDVPDAPPYLVSPIDVENAAQMVDKEAGAAAYLASSAADITAKMLDGKLDLAGAVGEFNKTITEGGKRFGEGAIAAGSAGYFDDLANRWTNSQNMNMQAKIALMPLIRDAMETGIDIQGLQQHLLNNHMAAMEQVAGVWGVTKGLMSLDQAKEIKGAAAVGVSLDQKQHWSDEERRQVAIAGNTLFNNEVETTEQAQLDNIIKMMDMVEGVGLAQGARKFAVLNTMFGELWGSDGRLTEAGRDMLAQSAKDASKKLRPAEGEAPQALPDDFNKALALVSRMAKRGILDDPETGITYSDLSVADLDSMLKDGTIEARLGRMVGTVTNPDGTSQQVSLNDILFDESGRLNNAAVYMIDTRDPKKLASGDPDTWNVLWSTRHGIDLSMPFPDEGRPGGFVSALVNTTTDEDGSEQSEMARAAGNLYNSSRRALWGTLLRVANEVNVAITGKQILTGSQMEGAIKNSLGIPAGDLAISDEDIAQIAPFIDEGIEKGIIQPPPALPPDHPLVTSGNFGNYLKTTLVDKAEEYLQLAPPEDRARLMGTEAGQKIMASTYAERQAGPEQERIRQKWAGQTAVEGFKALPGEAAKLKDLTYGDIGRALAKPILESSTAQEARRILEESAAASIEGGKKGIEKALRSEVQKAGPIGMLANTIVGNLRKPPMPAKPTTAQPIRPVGPLPSLSGIAPVQIRPPGIETAPMAPIVVPSVRSSLAQPGG